MYDTRVENLFLTVQREPLLEGWPYLLTKNNTLSTTTCGLFGSLAVDSRKRFELGPLRRCILVF